MIKVEGVTKRYGTTTAVRNISFEVARGEIVGFLGPNGAGKTTTMRVLTGFLPPTEGTASVAGYDVLDEPLEVKKRIGYLPESPPLYTEMEAADYLEFVARIKGIPGAEVASRVDAAVERTAIGDVRHKVIGKLSKGFKQRVGLAQALIHNPDVLVLDEPTNGLDPKQIIEVRELIRSLAGEHTIILSTHILSEVASTCGRIIIINEGRIEASDTPENLTARLQGGEATEIELDGPIEEIERKLNEFEGAGRVVRLSDVGRHSVWRVEAPRSDNTRAQLARLAVESGWGLYALKPIGLSLEDIFLKITTEHPAVAEIEQGVEPAAAEASRGESPDEKSSDEKSSDEPSPDDESPDDESPDERKEERQL